MLSPIQRLEGNCVDQDEVGHYETPQQDLRCLQIQLLSSLVLKELITYRFMPPNSKKSGHTALGFCVCASVRQFTSYLVTL